MCSIINPLPSSIYLIVTEIAESVYVIYTCYEPRIFLNLRVNIFRLAMLLKCLVTFTPVSVQEFCRTSATNPTNFAAVDVAGARSLHP